MPYPDAGVGCPITGRKRGRGPDMLMCRPCWSRVPSEIQREVYAAWKLRREGADGTERHEAARRAAIEAVERRAAIKG